MYLAHPPRGVKGRDIDPPQGESYPMAARAGMAVTP